MKVKTNLKVGVWDYGRVAQRAVQSVGESASNTWQKMLNVLFNPKFWTWPF